VTDQRGVEAGVQVRKPSVDDVPHKSMVLIELQFPFQSVARRQHLLKLVPRSWFGRHGVSLDRINGQDGKLLGFQGPSRKNDCPRCYGAQVRMRHT
jgi:hypothetical protein